MEVTNETTLADLEQHLGEFNTFATLAQGLMTILGERKSPLTILDAVNLHMATMALDKLTLDGGASSNDLVQLAQTIENIHTETQNQNTAQVNEVLDVITNNYYRIAHNSQPKDISIQLTDITL